MLERDLSVLRLLNAVPSLDPFLLREHLRNNEIEWRPAISPSPKATRSACTTSSARKCRG